MAEYQLAAKPELQDWDKFREVISAKIKNLSEILIDLKVIINNPELTPEFVSKIKAQIVLIEASITILEGLFDFQESDPSKIS